MCGVFLWEAGGQWKRRGRYGHVEDSSTREMRAKHGKYHFFLGGGGRGGGEAVISFFLIKCAPNFLVDRLRDISAGAASKLFH